MSLINDQSPNISWHKLCLNHSRSSYEFFCRDDRRSHCPRAPKKINGVELYCDVLTAKPKHWSYLGCVTGINVKKLIYFTCDEGRAYKMHQNAWVTSCCSRQCAAITFASASRCLKLLLTNQQKLQMMPCLRMHILLDTCTNTNTQNFEYAELRMGGQIIAVAHFLAKRTHKWKCGKIHWFERSWNTEKWSKIESCIKLEKLCQPNFIQFLSHLEINIYNNLKIYKYFYISKWIRQCYFLYFCCMDFWYFLLFIVCTKHQNKIDVLIYLKNCMCMATAWSKKCPLQHSQIIFNKQIHVRNKAIFHRVI